MSELKHILVVDDEVPVLFVLQHVLDREAKRYEVTTASDGCAALSEAQKRHYDLVITDLSMPGIGGMELTQALKDACPDACVVWITAYGSPALAQEAGRLGVYRLLYKPLEVREIRDIVRVALEGTNGHGAADDSRGEARNGSTGGVYRGPVRGSV